MQQLWSGQGALSRITLLGPENRIKTLVIKQIVYSSDAKHPRGWDSDQSMQRKRRSYEIEMFWYQHFSGNLKAFVAMPKLIYSETKSDGLILVLEDMAVNYPIRFTAGKEDKPSATQIKSCIGWLARFHSRSLSTDANGLWSVGGYWHLDTRPDEWEVMPEGVLKNSASSFDDLLRSCPHQTIIHGDAKLANFCFDESGEQVAGVDFQYVGAGPGVKDLMLLLSSVLPDDRLLTEADGFVDFYFDQLSDELSKLRQSINPSLLIKNWRLLYPVAWADFYRFLQGWSPGHWKVGEYCIQQTEIALKTINGDAFNWIN